MRATRKKTKIQIASSPWGLGAGEAHLILHSVYKATSSARAHIAHTQTSYTNIMFWSSERVRIAAL